MITAAINIGIYTIAIFLLGMYKPQWPLFFMQKPTRMMIMTITLVGVMVSVTLFSEGVRQKKLAQGSKPAVEQAAVPVPVPDAQ